MARPRIKTTGGHKLAAFVAQAKAAQRRNARKSIDVGWINNPGGATVGAINELGIGHGPQGRPRPSLRNTGDRMGEESRPILKTIPPTMAVTGLQAGSIAKKGEAVLREELQRQDVKDTGKLIRSVTSRVNNFPKGVNA